MALIVARADLQATLERLRSQAADSLLWVITENRPGDSSTQSSPPLLADHYLVGLYGGCTTELLGLIDAALRASARIQTTQPGATLGNLVECQRLIQQMVQHFYHKMISFASLDDLTSLASAGSAEWADWAENVKVELESCHALLDAVGGALLACWQEIAEGMGSHHPLA